MTHKFARATPDESNATNERHAPHVARLAARLAPVRAASQVIHGDLTGNVLFDETLPPAVIDLSVYWRPAEFATAIVVTDALVWEEAARVELKSAMDIDQFGQLLVRALLFRIIADVVADPHAMDARAASYAPVVDLAVGLTLGPPVTNPMLRGGARRTK